MDGRYTIDSLWQKKKILSHEFEDRTGRVGPGFDTERNVQYHRLFASVCRATGARDVTGTAVQRSVRDDSLKRDAAARAFDRPLANGTLRTTLRQSRLKAERAGIRPVFFQKGRQTAFRQVRFNDVPQTRVSRIATADDHQLALSVSRRSSNRSSPNVPRFLFAYPFS